MKETTNSGRFLVEVSAFDVPEEAAATTGAVTRNDEDISASLVVQLASSDVSEAVPGVTQVTIPAGQTSASFPISAVDDTLADGTQAAVIIATAPVPNPEQVIHEATFGTVGVAATTLRDSPSAAPVVKVQSDGKLLALGRHSTANDALTVVRLNSDGALDSTFGINGAVTTTFAGVVGFSPRAIDVYPDGRIMVLGSTLNANTGALIARYNADGTPDTTFTGDGQEIVAVPADFVGVDLLANADGSMFVLGRNRFATDTNEDSYLSKVLSDGSVAFTRIFDIGANCYLNDLDRDANGKLIASGGASGEVVVARFNPADGSLDTSFSGDGSYSFPIPGASIFGSRISVQSDGKIVIGGVRADLDLWIVARLNSNGSLDNGFDADGTIVISMGQEVFSTGEPPDFDVMIQSDGRIVMSGTTWDASSDAQRTFMRLNANGSFDTTTTFSQNTAEEVLWVNGQQGDSNKSLNEFGVRIRPDWLGEIQVGIQPRFAAPTDWAMISAIAIRETCEKLVVDSRTLVENQGSTSITVRRCSTNVSQPLVVSLSSSDTTEATVPATMTIPAGQASASFTLTVVDDAILDGTQQAVITASAAGIGTGTGTMFVNDYEPLAVSVDPDSMSENGGSITGTVTRVTDIGQPLRTQQLTFVEPRNEISMKFSHSWMTCILLLLCTSVTQGSAAELPKPIPAIQPGQFGRSVNPFIGTGGTSYLCGFTFPGVTLPFGMVRLSPDTVSRFGKRATNSSGYYYSDPLILGFSHTRLVGTGATDGGNFTVIPTFEKSAADHHRGLLEKYSHHQENAFPGYYGVVLPGLGITAEFTATCRVGLHRYTFEGDQPPHILINVTSVLGKGKCSNGQVRILPEQKEVEGSAETFGTFSSRYGGLKTYFVLRFDTPLKQFGTWKGETFSTEPIASGNELGADLGFARSASPQSIQLKLALSYVSVENARANLNAEAGTKSFDQILADAVNAWEQKLSLIQVEGPSDTERTIFYSALYRSLQMPTSFNDVNREYTGFDRQVHRTDGFNYYTDMSLWDTFRTAHPLYTLIQPREQRDMVVSLLQMAKQGGYLPRWPSGIGYTNSMFGTPADIVITETYLKGIRDFDVEAAYGFMKKAALAPVPPNSKFSGRVGVEHYLKYEYCPADRMKKSVAATIEYCYADHAIARLAAALGHSADAAEFNRHAGYYRNLWNPETQFFHPRDSHGKFLDAFQPDLLTYLDVTGNYTHAYVEGSAWQWRWGVPSDADALVALFKSREYFVQELNTFFSKSLPAVGQNPNAYYWQGNQPDLYAAYLFNHAGRPDLTQKWVRWVLQNKYGPLENGLDGNDDGGTLSAWYVFSSLGLYPTAGTDRYEIGSPLWSRAEIKLQDKPFVIVADKNASDRPYVQRIWLNEKPLDRYWLHHHEIAQGGSLRFEMGPEPPVAR